MVERSDEAGGASAVPQAPQMNVTGWGVRLILWMSLGFVIISPVNMLAGRLRDENELRARTVCAGNLHAIGKSVALYASENEGSFPPDFYALLQDGQPVDYFQCPSTGTPEPNTSERVEFEAHCDYVYIGGVDSDAPGATILAFELPLNHSQEYVSLLRADFSVYNKGAPGFATVIQKSNDYLSEKRRGQR